jgi:two-component system, NarL family, response regulator NreC
MFNRVLIADDHALVREGIGILISRGGFTVVAEASNGQEALAHASRDQPDLAVLDMSMPIMNGLETAQEMRKLSPRTRSIVLSRYDGLDDVLAAMRAGVKGYVLKSQSVVELLQALNDVATGGFYLSPGVAGVVVDAVRSQSPTRVDDPLTARERQVIKLIAEGYSTRECATILGVSVKTADSHRTRLMRKLDIHGTAGLVRYAVRHHFAEV